MEKKCYKNANQHFARCDLWCEVKGEERRERGGGKEEGGREEVERGR